MKNLILLSTALLTIFFFNSCEDLLNDKTSAEIAVEISGVWSCDEDRSLKTTMDNFTVEIWPSEFDSTVVYISNFNQLGDEYVAEAQISNYNITIRDQPLVGGYRAKGSGTISQNLKEINMNYSVDDGSGVFEEYNSSLEFLRDF